jgi:hypothetical protein
LAEDTAFFLHPDALLMVMAKEMQVKISDLHSASKHGILMSVDLIFGCALGLEGNRKVIKVTAA